MMIPVPPRREPETPVPPKPPPAPGPKRSVRPRLTLVLVVLCLLSGGVWAYSRSRPDHPPNVSGTRSVEVSFYFPWGEERAPRSGARSDYPEVVAELVAVLQKAERAGNHKCGSRGFIVLGRSLGRTTKLGFLAGHDPEWYEVEYEGRFYRVPRAEFIAAMRRVGVDVPLTCP
jgi:hypothetical protein